MKADDKTGDDRLSGEVARIEAIINSPKMRDIRRNMSGGPTPAIRPRNASTIIVIDGKGDKARLLMGRRNRSLAFMPGALVFPGGSVDRGDARIPPADALHPDTEAKIVANLRGSKTPGRARALAMAAVRELSEETGLLIGTPGMLASPHPDWSDFRDRQIVPKVGGMVLFSRAITPPGAPRRFDTWFFIARADDIAHVPEGGFTPSGELEELQWLRPQDAIEGPTREITRVMLVELMRRLERDTDLDPAWPAPFYHTRNSRFDKKFM